MSESKPDTTSKMVVVPPTDGSEHSSTHDANNRLVNLYTSIKSIPDTEHVNLLRIISKYARETVNENSNGCFVNLSVLDERCITELTSYICFIHAKNAAIGNIEKRMGDIESSFF